MCTEVKQLTVSCHNIELLEHRVHFDISHVDYFYLYRLSVYPSNSLRMTSLPGIVLGT